MDQTRNLSALSRNVLFSFNHQSGSVSPILKLFRFPPKTRPRCFSFLSPRVLCWLVLSRTFVKESNVPILGKQRPSRAAVLPAIKPGHVETLSRTPSEISAICSFPAWWKPFHDCSSRDSHTVRRLVLILLLLTCTSSDLFLQLLVYTCSCVLPRSLYHRATQAANGDGSLSGDFSSE